MKMKVHRRIWTCLAFLLPMGFNACGKYEVRTDMESTMPAFEPLQFDRSSVPQAVKSAFTLRGSCQSGFALRVAVEGIEQPAIACNGTSFSVIIQLTGNDGPKVITIASLGSDGRERQDSVTVIKDSTSPALNIVSVVPSSGSVVISGTCENNLPLSYGGDIASISSSVCANGLFQLTASLTSGTGAKSLQVSQSDIAGNRGMAVFSWNPDTSAPALTVSAPIASAYIGTSLTVAGLCETGLPVQISGTALAQAQQLSCPMGSYSTSITVSGGEGPKSVIVAQTDAAGNKTEVARNVTKDTLAPMVTIVAPAMNASFTTNSITVSGACESGVSVMILGSGVAAQVQTTCANSAYSSSVVLTSGSGQKIIDVQQTDLAGNLSKVSRTVSTTPPASTLSILQPAANSLNRGSITLSGACDNGATIAFSGDITSATNVTCANSSYSRALTLSTGEGLKTVSVKQTLGGVDSMTSRSFTKDSVAPMLAIAAPAANANVLGNFSISGTCESGLSVAITGTGLLASANASCANGSFLATVSATNGDGAKAFAVAQTDAAGNASNVSRSVMRATSQPKLTIVSPASGALVGNAITITGACETGLSVALSGTGLSQSVNATCASGMYSQAVTLSSGDGAKAISARQTDALDNAFTASLSVTKDTVAPSLSITEPVAGTMAEAGLTLKGACETGLSVKISGTGVASEVNSTCASQAYSAAFTFSAGDGMKMVTVSQTDAAGNVASVNRQFEKGSLNTPGAAFTAAKVVLNQYCISCHKAGGSAAFADFNLATESDFVDKGFVVAGQPDNSKLIYRMLRYAGPTAGARNMPVGYTTANFPAGAYDTLVNWVGQMTPPTTNPTLDTPFACQPSADPAPTTMRRLTKVEYVNTVKALLATQSSTDLSAIMTGIQPLIDTIPEDAGKFARTDSTIDQAHISGYFYVAQKLGELISASDARMKAFFGSCASTADLSTSCLDTFFANRGVKVYRRPLTSTETASLKTNFSALAAGDRNGGFVTRLLTSVNFLMHVEANGTEISTGLLQLTPYELASRLSYHFLSSMPDDQLFAVAADGSLMQDSVYQAQVTRLTSGNNLTQMQNTTSEFFSQWLDLHQLVGSLNSTAPAYVAFANGASVTKASLQQEIQDMVTYYAFTKAGTFTELLSSPYSFAKNQDLASIYGVARWSGDASQLVSFPAGQRSGLFTRAAFLVSGSASTNPVRRGLKLRQDVLCDVIPPPPSEIGNMIRIPDADPLLTTRQRYEQKTSPALCMSCHTQINPLGFALEHFDGLGRYRLTEKIYNETNGAVLAERNVDAVVSPSVIPSDTRKSTNPVEFNQILADTGKAQKCFVQKYYNFAYRQPANVAVDGCALEEMRQNLMGTGGSIKKMMTNVPMARAFKLKKLAQ